LNLSVVFHHAKKLKMNSSTAPAAAMMPPGISRWMSKEIGELVRAGWP
jgi:hypothetical protein